MMVEGFMAHESYNVYLAQRAREINEVDLIKENSFWK